MCFLFRKDCMNLDESKMYRKVQEKCLEKVGRSN